MPTTADLLYHAFEQQPTKFSDTFSEIIGQKAADAIEKMKIDVAQSMFATEEDDEKEVDVPEVEADVEEEQEESDEEFWDDLSDDSILSDEELDATLADLLDSEESENGQNS